MHHNHANVCFLTEAEAYAQELNRKRILQTTEDEPENNENGAGKIAFGAAGHFDTVGAGSLDRLED